MDHLPETATDLAAVAGCEIGMAAACLFTALQWAASPRNARRTQFMFVDQLVQARALLDKAGAIIDEAIRDAHGCQNSDDGNVAREPDPQSKR